MPCGTACRCFFWGGCKREVTVWGWPFLFLYCDLYRWCKINILLVSIVTLLLLMYYFRRTVLSRSFNHLPTFRIPNSQHYHFVPCYFSPASNAFRSMSPNPDNTPVLDYITKSKSISIVGMACNFVFHIKLPYPA